jgi:antitoxin component YwqK of YwqJK toxin-antitoxin module
MYKFSLSIIFFLALCFTACRNDTVETKHEDKKVLNDSLSKLEQRLKNDSLKKTNPLLILPPDSTYTGDYVDKYPTGIVKFKGFFRFGKKHGHWMSFYPTGELWSEAHYDKGLREGPNITYFENGKKRYTGFYRNDVRDSTWEYYETSGKLAKKVQFKNDKVVKELPVK